MPRHDALWAWHASHHASQLTHTTRSSSVQTQRASGWNLGTMAMTLRLISTPLLTEH
jgi:hypothetical protein